MNKFNKRDLFSFGLGVLVTSFISVSAAMIYNAKDIIFTPNDSNWEVNNVQDAINDISNKIVDLNNQIDTINSYGNATTIQIKKGYTAYVKGNLITGSYVPGLTFGTDLYLDSERDNGTTITLSGFEVGAYYMCSCNMRGSVSSYTMSGATNLKTVSFGNMLDYTYFNYMHFIKATSTSVSITYPNSSGISIHCVKLIPE